jgi:adenylyltransferase/sulfurtransferase
VELSNLQRQVLHRTVDAGRAKTESAARTLRALNPDITVVPYPVAVSAANAAELVSGYDVVVDAVDNLAVRYLVNDACVSAPRPLIEAGVSGTGGYLTTFLPGGRPCYRCLFPEPPGISGEPEIAGGTAGGRATGGILGTVPGVVGVLEATEALKVLLGRGATLAGHLLFVDLWTNDFRLVETAPAPGCPVCGKAGGEVEAGATR